MKVFLAIIVIAAILGGGIYFYSNSKMDSGDDEEKNTEVSETSDKESFLGSARDLLKSGKKVTCEMAFDNAGGQISGMVYVDGELMRGDFTMAASNGVSTDMHVIRDTEWQYTWGKMLGSGGLKSKIVQTEGDSKDNSQFDLDMETDFNCSEWKVDESKFTPPSDVSFSDVTPQMEQMQNAVGSMKKAQCDSCNQIPAGPNRDQCLQSVGC